MIRKKCYSISNYQQLVSAIKINKNKNEIIVIYINYRLVNGFGVDWLKTIIYLSYKLSKKSNIRFYVDCGTNYGLCILLIEEKINYLKIKTNNIIFKKISQMAKKNKVLLNPNFDIVHLKK